jgi:voltage-gated potassium channel Kch
VSTLRIVIGTLLVVAILWEVFHELFHPSGRGALSDWIGRSIFAIMRRHKSLLPAAGPLSLILVILAWMVGLVIGFALIYSARFPTAFQTSTSSTPPADHAWLTATYFSFETLVTLGYGDLMPRVPGLRLVATVEALLGFALLTASVSSIVLIYPALTRTRTLALGVAHLAAAEANVALSPARVGSDVFLAGLARDVTQMRIDLIHFPMTYFFAPDNADASVASWTGVLARFARDGRAADQPAHVRVAAAALDAALDGLADVLRRRFRDASSEDREKVFDAVAEAHRVTRRS